MKHTTASFIRSVTLVMVMATFMYGTSTSSQEPESLVSGYIIPAKAGSQSAVFNCGDDILVTVANSSIEITTGTEVWIGHTQTLHYPDGVITSKTGSTDGQSFYVENGIVGSSATPCY
jgi:ribonuclease BN (tRNA processing enzyme)